jgi:hypothetical protein
MSAATSKKQNAGCEHEGDGLFHIDVLFGGQLKPKLKVEPPPA